MISKARTAIDNLLRAQLDNSVEPLKQLSLDRVSDAERIATAARFLVHRSRDKALFPPIERRWILLLAEQRVSQQK